MKLPLDLGIQVSRGTKGPDDARPVLDIGDASLGSKRRLDLPKLISCVPGYGLPLAIWSLIAFLAPAIGLYSTGLSIRSTAVVAAQRDAFELTDPILLSTSPLIRAQGGSVLLAAPPGQSLSGEVAAKLIASGQANLVLEDATLLVTGVDTPTGEAVTGAEAPLLDALVRLNYESLTLRRSNLSIMLPGGQIETLRGVDATITLKRKSSLHAKGTGQLRGRPISFETTLTLQSDRKGTRVLPARIQFRDENLAITVDGKVTLAGPPQLQGDALVTIENLRDAARWLGAPWPPGQTLRNLLVKGQLDWTSASLSFERSQFKMDGNEATGALELNFAGARPAITGTLAFRTLDLTPYVKTTTTSDTGLSWSSLAGSPLKLPLGTVLDADVRISSDKVTAAGFDMGRSAASVTLRGGRLQADVAEVQIQGGTGVGQIAADFSGFWPKVSLRGKLEAVDLGKPLSTMLGQNIIQGSATVIADLNASGNVASDLLSSLNGKLNVRAETGGRIGADLRGMLNTAQATPYSGWTVAKRAQTSYDQLDVKLQVQDGIVTTEGTRIVSGTSTWTAEGQVDLPASRIDLRVLTGSGSSKSPQTTASKLTGVEISGEISTPAVKLVEREPR